MFEGGRCCDKSKEEEDRERQRTGGEETRNAKWRGRGVAVRVTFQQRVEGCEGGSHGDVCGKNVLNRANSQN